MFKHGLGIHIRCWTECSNILARFSVHEFMSICTRALSLKGNNFSSTWWPSNVHICTESVELLFPREQQYFRD